MTIKSITPKNQALVNKAVKWLLKYNDLDIERNIADSDGNEKLYNQLDRKCERAFDKYLEYVDELPKRERAKIEKSELY